MWNTIFTIVSNHNGEVEYTTEDGEIISTFEAEADMISCKIDLTELGISCYNYTQNELIIKT